jgi:hypothetical protein
MLHGRTGSFHAVGPRCRTRQRSTLRTPHNPDRFY